LGGLSVEFHPAPHFFQQALQLTKLFFLNELLQCGAIEINNQTAANPFVMWFEITFVTAPQVGNVRAKESEIPTVIRFYGITNEFGTGTVHYQKKLVFRVCVPGRIEVPVIKLPYKKDTGFRDSGLFDSRFFHCDIHDVSFWIQSQSYANEPLFPFIVK